ncbi:MULTISPECIES: C40 family peptidase [Catenuloplanes]|uniref:Cell wall-associated NlpC family hydrolase n=1 Tax=Catenuloplanes niger TaxID=587534 RepID=A0AAE3ZQH0_9ACTN|nr:NlpC/P60 family protein [Catenuloplanes niger]MDR7323222.1 cell wall-associated NlpC family hydrolase [Catenuloplanes niger]
MPRTDLGGITHVPTTRRALTGVLALTVAGIAAAGPAHDSHAADGRPTAAAASPTEERGSAAGVAPDDRPLRLIGLRPGIHPRSMMTRGDEVHAGPAGAGRALERTGRHAAPRSAKAASRSAKAAPRSSKAASRSGKAASRSAKATPRTVKAASRSARAVKRTKEITALRPSLTRRTGTVQKQRMRAEIRRHTGDVRKRSARWHDARDRKARHASKVTYRKGKQRKSVRPAGELGRVVEYALNQVGKPYRRNAAGPGSYDCSGLVSVAYKKAGVKLPHSSHAIARKGKKVRRADLRPGDVVLPQSGHVGIYLGNGKMVHAATPRKGVVVSKMYGFSTARRLL